MTDYPDYTSKFPELGFYGLPGHTRSPREILDQVRHAEALGIGNVMISERPDYKEIASICGAVAAVTEDIFIGTSATNGNTRHPLITASMGSTLNALSEGRFALGLAKGGGKARWRMMDLAPNDYARTEELIGLLRRLWNGETIEHHEGKLGTFTGIKLADYVRADVPLLYVGFGPTSLEHAGRHFDGTHLHTFMSDQCLAQAVQHVRNGEAAAGRPTGTVKNWSVFATLCEPDEQRYLKAVVGRLATYLQIPGYGDMLAAINGWDPEVLQRFRTHRAVTSVGGLIDSVATLDQLAEIDKLIPEAWRPAAIGSPQECARRWLDQFEAGADGIIIHASTPEQFEPVLSAYEAIRPAERFAGRTNRPA
ncbi:MAG: TIGR03857 family LLM class F420-dependent oxidoreductase [Pseudomonadota bacterium]